MGQGACPVLEVWENGRGIDIEIKQGFYRLVMKKMISLKQFTLPVFATFLLLPCFSMADGDHGERKTPLAKEMKEASKALKALRKLPKDDWEGGAKLARAAAESIRKSMAFTPVMFKDMKDGLEKEKAVADYRRLMGLNYASLCELELAYLAQDPAKVEAATKKWKSIKKEGHKKYEDD